jgi:hypothetical protein
MWENAWSGKIKAEILEKRLARNQKEGRVSA